jgi:hypothetical protein
VIAASERVKNNNNNIFQYARGVFSFLLLSFRLLARSITLSIYIRAVTTLLRIPCVHAQPEFSFKKCAFISNKEKCASEKCEFSFFVSKQAATSFFLFLSAIPDRRRRHTILSHIPSYPPIFPPPPQY